MAYWVIIGMCVILLLAADIYLCMAVGNTPPAIIGDVMSCGVRQNEILGHDIALFSLRLQDLRVFFSPPFSFCLVILLKVTGHFVSERESENPLCLTSPWIQQYT